MRSSGRGVGRDLLQHLDGGLPGGLHRPLVRRADRHDDDAAHRQLRCERCRHGIARSVRPRRRRARDDARAVELAIRGEPPRVPRSIGRRGHRGRRHQAPHEAHPRGGGHARGHLNSGRGCSLARRQGAGRSRARRARSRRRGQRRSNPIDGDSTCPAASSRPSTPESCRCSRATASSRSIPASSTTSCGASPRPVAT